MILTNLTAVLGCRWEANKTKISPSLAFQQHWRLFCSEAAESEVLCWKINPAKMHTSRRKIQTGVKAVWMRTTLIFQLADEDKP